MLEELQALDDALQASEQRRDILEATLFDVLATVPPERGERYG